jgi:hypothetical protein
VTAQTGHPPPPVSAPDPERDPAAASMRGMGPSGTGQKLAMELIKRWAVGPLGMCQNTGWMGPSGELTDTQVEALGRAMGGDWEWDKAVARVEGFWVMGR